MKRVLISMFVLFSLIIGPVAHAAGITCPDGDCAISEQSKEKKHESGKVAENGHHCCCAPMLDSFGDKTAEPFHVASSVVTLTFRNDLASITVDPLLQPPSHA